jgi:hypothetical protein
LHELLALAAEESSASDLDESQEDSLSARVSLKVSLEIDEATNEKLILAPTEPLLLEPR